MKVKDMADTGIEIPKYQNLSRHKPMTDIHVSEKGIETLLRNLNPHKAAGSDQISLIDQL